MDNDSISGVGKKFILKGEALPDLMRALKDAGYRLIGPTVRSGAIVYEEINSCDDLPRNVGDVQEAGTYRLRQRDDQAWFGFTTCPQSLKPLLYPPAETVFKASRNKQGFDIACSPEEIPKTAVLGVHPCDLNAILIHDRVLAEGEYRDENYLSRRKNVLLIVVNCTEAGNTCFCSSMATGPGATRGFDLALTEMIDSSEHYFVVETGSEQAQDIAAMLPMEEAAAEACRMVNQRIAQAAGQMGRTLDISGIKEVFIRNIDNVYWDSVGRRCLSCGNCTLVCPTCFCSTVQDVTDLTGAEAERIRRWDSCFNMEFSYIHGGSVRQSTKARYRQWITHKLAFWQDQFGKSGCVGCGRCITWCPVGIDVTAEARAIRQRDLQPAPAKEKTEV